MLEREDSGRGLELFAKYAFPPNFYRYCGPDRVDEVREGSLGHDLTENLRDTLSRFEGAAPYLSLIARSNKLSDPFGYSVVEAYWIGNELLDQVPKSETHKTLKNEVKHKLNFGFSDLENDISLGARPHHSFHVLEVCRMNGVVPDKSQKALLDFVNSCLIRWGRIERINQDHTEAYVLSEEVFFNRGRFDLRPKLEKIEVIGDLGVGDFITFHWNYICEKAMTEKVGRLKAWTKYGLDMLNQPKRESRF